MTGSAIFLVQDILIGAWPHHIINLVLGLFGVIMASLTGWARGLRGRSVEESRSLS
jgi:hypothetical protein